MEHRDRGQVGYWGPSWLWREMPLGARTPALVRAHEPLSAYQATSQADEIRTLEKAMMCTCMLIKASRSMVRNVPKIKPS